MTFLQNVFNSWFGSNITYISNAYSKSDYVRVIFHRENFKITKLTAKFPDDMAVEVKPQEEMEVIKISFGNFHQKRRTDSNLKLTIFPGEQDQDPIVVNYQICANRSFIVTNQHDLKPQMYGSNNMFLDEHGVDHTPK